MIESPSPNGHNGRDTAGRFASGNRFGRGNPHARQVADYQRAVREAVTDEDLRRITRKLVERAIAGDVVAAREVLDRVMGKAKVSIEVDDKRATDERTILQQINVILDRQPDLRRLLTGDRRELLDMPQGDNADSATDDPPPPQSDDDAQGEHT